ncbi:Protein phosphatase 2C 1 [Onygenales sp. PD_40]|nr:Protein phosphatase 2C 1 [Onygenales sp. PD_40]KAK2775123.1 Protein phosphatase 2C 1 [Emmonsiellopsis sp. PD_33]KAK2789435.1 Protein phosphatase 2C 1 [Onygenales sp. PD_10]KAK2791439.1 Protein phosphatase 2C 1 [Onygenales sp. PD_12]
MFGGSTSPTKEKDDPSPPSSGPGPTVLSINTEDTVTGRDKSTAVSSPGNSLAPPTDDKSPGAEGKRRSSSMTKAATFFSNAKNSLHLSGPRESKEPQFAQTPMQKLGRMDPALIVPQGSLNNSAGESVPTAHSSFRVGVTEDKNRKCRRTMEDTHAYLYNFLGTSAPTPAKTESSAHGKKSDEAASTSTDSDDSAPMIETDNGYFAIFDGHAGTFAAEWCGKKLHLILEEIMRKYPNAPVPELLDQTFTNVDQQLEKLPLKNSGCTAVTAVLRWEDRTTTVPVTSSANAVTSVPAASKTDKEGADSSQTPLEPTSSLSTTSLNPRTQETTARHRVLYTANVGDARVVLCRNGKALRLSYDHKGSDENEGKRISNAGGLILNNRVNGVLAVTRALGDSYMKDLVTGHPYTTETVIQPEADEFMILACDGLWDVCSDQDAVDLVRNTQDPQAASKILVDHALSRFSTDNLSCMIVRFDTKAIQQALERRTHPAGIDSSDSSSKQLEGISEADKIVREVRKSVAAGEAGIEEGDEEGVEDAEDAERMTPVKADMGPEVTPAQGIEPVNLNLHLSGKGKGKGEEGSKEKSKDQGGE